MSVLLVIKDHKPTLWSLTGPQQLLKLICSISTVFANYTQSALDLADDKDTPWRLGKFVSIWAFQTHSQGAVLVPSVASLTSPPFIRQLAVRYLHLRSESTNKESAFTSTDRPGSWVGLGCSDLELLSWARMPHWCQVLFWCRSIARAISECVALWRTSKRLRWNSLIVIETWATPFLKRSLSASTPWSTQLFIKDGYRQVWGERGFFKGSQQGEIIRYHLRLAQLNVCLCAFSRLRRLQTVSQVFCSSWDVNVRKKGTNEFVLIECTRIRNCPMSHNKQTKIPHRCNKRSRQGLTYHEVPIIYMNVIFGPYISMTQYSPYLGSTIILILIHQARTRLNWFSSLIPWLRFFYFFPYIKCIKLWMHHHSICPLIQWNKLIQFITAGNKTMRVQSCMVAWISSRGLPFSSALLIWHR